MRGRAGATAMRGARLYNANMRAKSILRGDEMSETEAQSELLHGWDDTSGIVAASSHEHEGAQYLRLYRRAGARADDAAGEIVTEDRAFMPFLLLADERFTDELKQSGGEVSQLAGELDYRFVARFATMRAVDRARRALDARFKNEYKRVADEYL